MGTLPPLLQNVRALELFVWELSWSGRKPCLPTSLETCEIWRNVRGALRLGTVLGNAGRTLLWSLAVGKNTVQEQLWLYPCGKTSLKGPTSKQSTVNTFPFFAEAWSRARLPVRFLLEPARFTIETCNIVQHIEVTSHLITPGILGYRCLCLCSEDATRSPNSA